MKRPTITTITICLTVLLALPAWVGAAESPLAQELLITEVKVKTGGDYDEFIELTNVSDEQIELGDYAVAYFGSPEPADLTKPDEPPSRLPAAGLPAGMSVVFAKQPGTIANSLQLPLDSLKDSGALLRIVRLADGAAVDQLAWTAATTEQPGVWLIGASSNTASKSQSLQRATDESGAYIVEEPQWDLADPAPQADELLIPEPEPEPEIVPPVLPAESADAPGAEPTPVPIESQPTAESAADEELTPEAYASLVITELLPNPAPPATDADDEYVEIFNPSGEAVDLTDYKLQTGSNYTYSFTFDQGVIAPGGYYLVYARDTSLSLSNTAGRARLLNPAGTVVSETAPYDTAGDGQAWMLLNGNWQWTATPSPGAANTLTAVIKLPATGSTKAAAAKKPATKAATTKKAATAKTAAAKAPKAAKTAAAKTTNPAAEAAKKPPLNMGILAGVGGLTLAYGAYEYRHDMANRFEQLRRNRAARRAAGPKS